MPSRKSTIKATNAKARTAGRKTHLNDPIYHDDNAARLHLEALLWPHGPVCPHCGVIGNATAMNGATTRPGLYKCKTKECRKPFTVTMRERSWSGRTSGCTNGSCITHFTGVIKKGMSALQLPADAGRDL